MDYRFFHRLGATILDRTICTAAADEGYRYSVGDRIGTDLERFPDARVIICWGTNPVTSNPHLIPFIKAAQDNGATFVVIDPRRTRTAERADWHLQPHPGSDAALALGLMHVIIAEGLHDEAYVREHTLGFDELRERVGRVPPGARRGPDRYRRRGNRQAGAALRHHQTRCDPPAATGCSATPTAACRARGRLLPRWSGPGATRRAGC